MTPEELAAMRRVVNELDRAAREAYRMVHSISGDLAARLSYPLASALDSSSEALDLLQKGSGS